MRDGMKTALYMRQMYQMVKVMRPRLSRRSWISTRASKLAAVACGIAIFGALVVAAATALRPMPLVQANWLPDAGSGVTVAGTLASDDDRTTPVAANELPPPDAALPPTQDGTLSPVESAADNVAAELAGVPARSGAATEAPASSYEVAETGDTSATAGDDNGAGVGSMNFGSGLTPSPSQFDAEPTGGAGRMAPVGGPNIWAMTPSPSAFLPTASSGPTAALPGPNMPSTVVPTSSSSSPSQQFPAPTGGASLGPSQQTSTPAPSQQTSTPGSTQQTGTPGQTADNPVKPSNDGPVFELPITACSGKTCQSWQYFDPIVAIGYNYQLKPTDPSSPLTFGITAIKAPTKIGDGKYELYLYNVITGSYVDVGQEIDADPNNSFDVVAYLQSLNPAQDAEFGISDPEMGLNQFSIRGIDPSAGVDPNDPNAFITGLLFTGEINGNLFITPLTVDTDQGGDGVVAVADAPTREIEVVSEPHSLSVFVLGLLLMLFGIRHRRKTDR
jgi:hypothetical protein